MPGSWSSYAPGGSESGPGVSQLELTLATTPSPNAAGPGATNQPDTVWANAEYLSPEVAVLAHQLAARGLPTADDQFGYKPAARVASWSAWPRERVAVLADGPDAEVADCIAAYGAAGWDARLARDWPLDELTARRADPGRRRMSVQLRLLDKADKEILKLPRAVKGAIYDFQRKFREDPNSHGLQFKQLAGNSRLYSARVTADYRALLLQVSGTEYLLVAVKPRGSVYENLDRYAFGVNPVSGGIEFIDIVDTTRCPGSRGLALRSRGSIAAVRRLLPGTASRTRRRGAAAAADRQDHHRGRTARPDGVRAAAHRRGTARAARRAQPG